MRYNNKGKILPLRMQIISSKADPYLDGKQNENGRVPQKQILIVKENNNKFIHSSGDKFPRDAAPITNAKHIHGSYMYKQEWVWG